MTVAILDVRGAPLVPADGVFLVEEARTYRISAPDAHEVWLGDRRLGRGAGGHYEVVLGHHVGALDLQVAAGDGSVLRHRLDVRPRADKLSPALWLKLLEELEEGLAGLSVGVEGPTHGVVDTAGVAAPLLVSALLPLVPALVAALQAVLGDPRSIDREQLDQRNLRDCRRIDSSMLAWVGRHPEVARWLDGWRAAELVGEPPRIPIHTPRRSLDHPVNRAVAWLTGRVIASLVAVADRLDEIAGRVDEPAWCRGRAARARAAALRIRGLQGGSWLREVTPEPASEAAVLVLSDEPNYARFQRLARRFCSPAFRLAEVPGEPGAAVRPSFSLYELWCLFALRERLQAALPGWRWSTVALHKLLALTGSGGGAAVVARRGELRLRIDFNRSFPSWYCRRDGPHSLSGERRPDFVVSLDGGPGGDRWVVLDAKYRAGRENLASGLASVHLYRDSLVDPARGGRCVGAMLLAPSRCDVPEWFDPAWQHTHGFGITALAPGSDAGPLVAWICGNLGVPDAARG